MQAILIQLKALPSAYRLRTQHLTTQVPHTALLCGLPPRPNPTGTKTKTYTFCCSGYVKSTHKIRTTFPYLKLTAVTEAVFIKPSLV